MCVWPLICNVLFLFRSEVTFAFSSVTLSGDVSWLRNDAQEKKHWNVICRQWIKDIKLTENAFFKLVSKWDARVW